MFTTTSFYINNLRNAVEVFEQSYKGFGSVSVLPTHIDPEIGAMAHARSEDRNAVEMVERIAFRLEDEMRNRHRKNAELRAQCEAGVISEEEYIDSLNWA